MANKVNVSVDVDVNGFQQGMSDASKAVEKFERSVADIDTKTNTLKRALREAKKESDSLALAWSKLDQEARSSKFGVELKAKLEEAMKKTAELVDLNGDLTETYKNLADDQRWVSTLKDGFDLLVSASTGIIGTIATFTGNEEDAKRATSALTATIGLLNTANKVQAALQKQSNLMLAIGTVQSKAKAAADKLAAKSTGELTIAQRAFNMVAKANPYALLAAALVTVVGAIGAYIVSTRKAESETKKFEDTLHNASIEGQKDAQAEITKLDLLYKAAINESLSKEERAKATEKLQKLYPEYFGNMSKEQIMLGQSSAAYQQLKDDIIAVAMAKAYEQKITEIAKEKVDLEDQLETQQQITKELDKQAKAANNAAQNRPKTSGGAVPSGDLQGQIAINNAVVQSREEENKLTKQIKEKTAAQDKYLDKINETSRATQRLEKNEEQRNNIAQQANKNVNKSTTTRNTVQTTYTTDSLTALEHKLSDLQSKYKNGLIKITPDDYKKQVEDLERQIKDKKIELGLELPETTEQKLKNEIARLQTELAFTLEGSVDEAEIKRLIALYQKRLEKEQARLKVEPELEWTAQDQANLYRRLDEIANPNKEFEYDFDFSNLPDKFKDASDKLSKELEESKSKLEAYSAVMNEPDASDAQIAEAQRRIDVEKLVFEELKKQGQAYEEMSKKQKKLNDTIQASGDMLNSLGSIASSVSTLFGDNAALNATAIIAQAVANYILGWTEATAKAAKLGPIGWAAFGLSTAAQVFAMIAQIKNAAKFADGGVVRANGGHTTGDKILARLNENELVLNQKQQKRLLDMLDNIVVVNSQQTVNVVGTIKGDDIVLTTKRVIKKAEKQGKKINIG